MAHNYRAFAIVDCCRSGAGRQVLLEDGPLDGAVKTILLLSAGLFVSATWPDADDGEVDYFYWLTKRASRGLRIARFQRRRVRA
jgi:hypothetical protein